MLKNPFTNTTRLLFIDCYACFGCGKNRNLELHHIRGRVSNSPLNAAVLCRECHEHTNQDVETVVVLMRHNFVWLTNVHYKLTVEDEDFLRDHCADIIGRLC